MKRVVLSVLLLILLVGCVSELPQEPKLPGESSSSIVPVGKPIEIFVDVPEDNEWASPALDVFNRDSPVALLTEREIFNEGSKGLHLRLHTSINDGYIYNTAAYMAMDTLTWKQIILDGNNRVGNWFKEKAKNDVFIPREQLNLEGLNYMVVYACSKQEGAFACGCRSEDDELICSEPTKGDYKWFLVSYDIEELPYEPELPSGQCQDSDGGDNINVQGFIKGPKLITGEIPKDYCIGSKEGILVEYSCSEDGGFSKTEVENLFSKSVKCQTICESGKCSKFAPTASAPPPVAYWKLDGNAVNSVRVSKGVVDGATIVDGKFGQAYSFDGDDHIELSSEGLPIGNLPRTITMWVKRKQEGGQWGDILSYGQGDCTGKMFGIGSINGKLSFWGGCQDLESIYLPIDKWTFVAVSYDGKTITNYVNEKSMSADLELNTQESKLFIGAETTNNGDDFRYHFNGEIDDIKVFDKALSKEQIQSISGIRPTTKEKVNLDVPILVLEWYPQKDGILHLNEESIAAELPLLDGMEGISVDEAKIKVKRLTEQSLDVLQKGATYRGHTDTSTIPSINYFIYDTLVFNEEYPKIRLPHVEIPYEEGGLNPFVTDWQTMFKEVINICDYVDNHGVRQVWSWGYPAPIDGWESNMAGPYGDFSNSDRDADDMPVCEHTYTLFQYNYGRDVSEAIEDHTHQIEAVMSSIQNELWTDLFIGRCGDKEFYRCGWTHYPPNVMEFCTGHDYDWFNEREVLSDCGDWKPDGSGEKKIVSCHTWAETEDGFNACSNSDARKDAGASFKQWWMQNIPGKDNDLEYEGKPLRNWWEFISDFDNAMAKGKCLACEAETDEIDLDVTYISRFPKYDYDSSKGWPSEGDLTTFKGHIINKGKSTSPPFSYAWFVDDVKVSEKKYEQSLRSGQEIVVEHLWNWEVGPHTIELKVDIGNSVNEISEENNAIKDLTNALAVGLWVEESVYNFFNEHQHKLGIGSNSWEDWAQRQMRIWNELFKESVHPLSPNGIEERVRLDTIVVVPNNGLPVVESPGPGAHPDLRNKNVDMMWGFTHDLIDEGAYQIDGVPDARVSDENTFYVERGLMHEMSHARYLVDLYAFGVVPDQVFVEDDQGNLIEGTDHLPVFGHTVYWDSNAGYIMSGGAPPGKEQKNSYSEHSAYAWNRVKGKRNKYGNTNSPPNIGEYLLEMADDNNVRVLDLEGKSIQSAKLKVYQSIPGGDTGYYAKIVDNIPEFTGETDENGLFSLGAYPFYGMENAIKNKHFWGESFRANVLLFEVRFENQVDYKFLDIANFNLAYWKADSEVIVIDLQTDISISEK